jgi:hypothetical protein
MSSITEFQEVVRESIETAHTTPKLFLSAYEILNSSELSWPVNILAVRLKGHELQGHDARGKIKDIIWKLRSQHTGLCKGGGFVIDISPRLVVVPAAWKLPLPISTAEYSVSLESSRQASARDSCDQAMIEGILRDAIKWYFKSKPSQELGPLWQDYNAFCQYPTDCGERYLMCRRFDCAARLLKGGVWVAQIRISTATIDGSTFQEYYLRGEVSLLAEMLAAKRRDRSNRQNRPVAVRVLQQYNTGSSEIRALELQDLDLISDNAQLPVAQQKALAASELRCKQFNKPCISVPLGELRLVLDTRITQEEHSEAIIEPTERAELMTQVWSYLNGADIFGKKLELSAHHFDADRTEATFIAPPAVQVKGAKGTVTLEAPVQASDQALKSRARERATHIARNGFLVSRPLNPALGWPSCLDTERGARMKRDLDFLWSEQGIEAKFGFVPYKDAQDIRRQLEQSGHDVLLAVLPERSGSSHGADDTHEKLKRIIEVPSQCIHYDNTLPEEWVAKRWRELKKEQPRTAKRVRDKYELCLANLLVKHHWFPFAPAQAFHYNVHVGLDVGGVHNTDAMACMGYGFGNPTDLLLFRPEEIPIEVQKAEPIPTDSLYRGLLALFEAVWTELSDCGIVPDFDSVLFYRDGPLLGDGEAWNERQALHRLREELVRRNWVSGHALWTALEVLKGAEGWRVLRNNGELKNPLVGTCLFPFEDEWTALVCTTGAPYLSQGTARPLKVHIIEIAGIADRHRVLRDLVWESDMCFSQPGMGMGLPWVLHVADTGALQCSRSYRITGIPA